MHICMVMAGDEEGGLEKHVIDKTETSCQFDCS